MAISKTDILNKALTQVGAAPVVSIDDDTNNARVLSRVYEISLKSLLAECEWAFAIKRALLTLSTDTLAWYETGKTLIYVKPSDSIRIFAVSDTGASWREEGDYIISDSSDLGVRYVYYIDTPSKYPGYFADAFIAKLSYEIAYLIVNSITLAEQYKKVYESIALPKAMAANSQTGDQQVIKDDAWELSKYQDTQSES